MEDKSSVKRLEEISSLHCVLEKRSMCSVMKSWSPTMCKKLFAILTLMLVSLPSTNPAFSQNSRAAELWQGSRLGMSPSQVRALFPTVETINNPGENGLNFLLKLEDRQLLEKPAFVQFGFQNGGLKVVELHLHDESLTQYPEIGMPFVRRVVDTLNNQLGQNGVCEFDVPKQRDPTASISCDWTLNGRAISLYYLHFYKKDAIFVINWKAGLPQSLNAL
jgi:hypothetical protein